MRSERALGTLSRVLRRLSFVGIAAGIAVSTMWHGCAGTNNDYMGNIVDGGTDDGPPPGSDLTCQKTPDPDVPDSSFVDNNCDGIDGDVNNAIFVSPSGDDTFAGTRENPVKTITQGIKLAQQQGKTGVYLDKGTYSGSVLMVAGIGVYGGYDSGNLWARSAANESLIQGGTTAITLSNIAKETHLELVSVKSADGTSAGQSSYGVFVVNSSGPVIIGQAKINSGNGANGTSPTAPTDVITPVAANGATGGNGCTGGGCNPAGPGGKGGLNSCLATSPVETVETDRSVTAAVAAQLVWAAHPAQAVVAVHRETASSAYTKERAAVVAPMAEQAQTARSGHSRSQSPLRTSPQPDTHQPAAETAGSGPTVAARAVVVQVVAAQVAHAIQTRAVVVVVVAQVAAQRLRALAVAVVVDRSVSISSRAPSRSTPQRWPAVRLATAAMAQTVRWVALPELAPLVEQARKTAQAAVVVPMVARAATPAQVRAAAAVRATVCTRRCRRWSPTAFRPAAAHLARLATAAKPPSKAHCPKHRLASSDKLRL